MGMTTTAEHRALRDAVREFLTATSEVLADQDTELGYRPEMWATMAEQLELQGMLVDAKYGGSGAGIGDLVVVAEEFGRSAACSPFFASSVLTTLAIADCARSVGSVSCCQVSPRALVSGVWHLLTPTGGGRPARKRCVHTRTATAGGSTDGPIT